MTGRSSGGCRFVKVQAFGSTGMFILTRSTMALLAAAGAIIGATTAVDAKSCVKRVRSERLVLSRMRSCRSMKLSCRRLIGARGDLGCRPATRWARLPICRVILLAPAHTGASSPAHSAGHAGVAPRSADFSRHLASARFLPAEDQGAFFAAMRLPEGASVNRTEELVAQVENMIRPIPGVQGVLSVVGLNFIDYVASSNQAFFVVRLKPYEERTAIRKLLTAS